MTIRIKVPDFSSYTPLLKDQHRLEDLFSQNVLDAMFEQRLGQCVDLARRVLNVRCAMIGLIRDGQASLGSIAGGDFADMGAALACVQAALLPSADAAAQPVVNGLCFLDGSPAHYVGGVGISGADGADLGFLCVVGDGPRLLEDGQAEILRQIAALVRAEIEARDRLDVIRREFQKRALLDLAAGLPNLSAFSSKLEQLVELADAESRVILLGLIRVEGFETLHAALGRPGAAFITEQLARRLRDTVPEPESIGQLRDDNLAIALNLPHGLSPPSCLDDILDRLSDPIEIGEHLVRLRISIGASVYPKDASDAESLLKRARTALWSIGPTTQSRYKLYQRQDSSRASREFEIETAMRQGLIDDEFALVFQPKISLADERLVGAEALIRWTSRTLGVITPTEFIPIAERSGLIGQLGFWVLEAACGGIQRWVTEGLECPGVAVNITSYQLRQPRFINEVKDLLTRYDHAVGRLDLELTESSLVDDIEGAIRVMRALRDLGVTFSIDDFGTGFSSLSYLRQMPIGVLKIDRSFVRSIPERREDMKLVRSIISMGHDLGLQVVAEGVETAAQAMFLKQARCDQAQGFYLSPPLAEADFIEYLIEQRSSPRRGQSSA